ncbi:MAG: hypothetical protein ACK5Q5_05410 [Planctomycetaceae bacterium]
MPLKLDCISFVVVGAVGTVLCLAVGGCAGESAGRLAMSGQVTRAEHPVPTGIISFRPSGEQSGPAANADIIEGRYRFSASDGPLPGLHRVSITIPPPPSKSAGARPAAAASQWTFEVQLPMPDNAADFELEPPE